MPCYLLWSTVPSPSSSGTFETFAVETVVMTLPALKTCFASWHAKRPVPLTVQGLADWSRHNVGRAQFIHPAGMNTVFPVRSPYFLSAWRAVKPARGIEAASSKVMEGGFRPMASSAHTTYWLQDPGLKLGLIPG